MTLNIFGYVVKVNVSVKKDTLTQSLYQLWKNYDRKVYTSPIVPMIKLYRQEMAEQGKELVSLKESKDYVDSLILKFKKEAL